MYLPFEKKERLHIFYSVLRNDVTTYKDGLMCLSFNFKTDKIVWKDVPKILEH
jgi:hypothetical protein